MIDDSLFDPEFLKVIKKEYPANDMFDVLSLTKLDISFSGENVKSIRGIEFFKNLVILNCSSTRLTDLSGIENYY